MFVLHVALQGCLKGSDVQYGMTADTGGHIRYLLDLVRASASDKRVRRILIATRAFAGYGPDYLQTHERIDAKTAILRLPTDHPFYLAKEEMGGEVASFAERLIEHIEAGDRPDLLHAHYADAASVAAIVKQRLGIPFLFTGHSLGRVKQAAFSGSGRALPGMAARIRAEEIALAKASLVIASSRDEAEVQYSGYTAYEPGRIRVVPPGSDLATFRNASCRPQVRREMERFLREPGKPCLLAIARPVARKNLTGLVEAYGQDARLRDMANLVVVAGTRAEIGELDEESACSMRQILELIDRYDLYGRIAYPKTHKPSDIPSYYAYARERGGVFVNPALNEPFGLTLLEAAASGLPLVATDSGGPNDIIETCGNGILVDPLDGEAVTGAARRILSDAALWKRYSKAGAIAAKAYDWQAHVARYHKLADRVIRPMARRPSCSQLLVCDIDNTLVGCEASLMRFGTWCSAERELCFAVATGRSFHSALAILEQTDLPLPRVMITSVGSEIYHLDAGGLTYTRDEGWAARLRKGWDRKAVMEVMSTVSGIAPQAPLEQRDFKLSYFCDGTPQRLGLIRDRLSAGGLEASIIQSHGRYLDILPAAASKGAAVAHVRKVAGLTEADVFVAGDSGNDIEMLRTSSQSIIVGNYSDGLANLPSLKHSYVARQTHALGIIEGVDHFRRLRRAP